MLRLGLSDRLDVTSWGKHNVSDFFRNYLRWWEPPNSPSTFFAFTCKKLISYKKKYKLVCLYEIYYHCKSYIITITINLMIYFAFSYILSLASELLFYRHFSNYRSFIWCSWMTLHGHYLFPARSRFWIENSTNHTCEGLEKIKNDKTIAYSSFLW